MSDTKVGGGCLWRNVCSGARLTKFFVCRRIVPLRHAALQEYREMCKCDACLAGDEGTVSVVKVASESVLIATRDLALNVGRSRK